MESSLQLWGKNYPTPTLIGSKVTLAAAGENHIVFATGNDRLIQHGKTMDLGRTDSGSLGYVTHSSIANRLKFWRGRCFLDFTAVLSTHSSSMVRSS